MTNPLPYNKWPKSKLPEEFAKDPLLTRDEVADIFRVAPKTVSVWIKTGRLTGLKLPGNLWRFRQSIIKKAIREWKQDG